MNEHDSRILAPKRAPIPGLPGYEIDTEGNAWTQWRRAATGRSYVIGTEWKPLKWCYNTGGYPSIRMKTPDGKRVMFLVHHLVLITFVGPRPDGMECRHLDGDRGNPRVGNVVWGTSSENAKDRVRHGTITGERNHQAKMTDEVAREVLRRVEVGGSVGRRTAKELGLSYSQVSKIRRGKKWKHLREVA